MTYENAINKLTEAFGAMAAVDIAMAIATRNGGAASSKPAKVKAERKPLELVDVDKATLDAFVRDYLATKAAYETDKSAYSTMARRLGFTNPMALGAIARTGRATADGLALLTATYGPGAINAKPKARKAAK